MDNQWEDDDVVFYGSSIPRSGRQHHYSQNLHNSSTGTYSLWRPVWWLFDVLTSPNAGVLVAIVAIVILQFKGHILDFWYSVLDDGLYPTLVDYGWSLLDITRAYYQMTCEVARSLRLGNGGAAALPTGGTTRGLLRVAASSSPGAPPPLVRVSEETTNGTMDTTPRKGGHIENGNTASDARSLSPSTASTSSVPQAPVDYSREAIEPAFLNEQDYPPGWLVYHAVLGVVAKEIADQYDHNEQKGQNMTVINQATNNPTILTPSIAASG